MTKRKMVFYKTSFKNKLVLTTIVLFMGLIISSFSVATMNVNQIQTNSFLLNHNLINREDSTFDFNKPMLDDPEPLATTWDVTINFNEPGSSTDYIIFGEATDASDGQDSYDIPNPPPGIPPFLDAYFTTTLSSPYDKLLQEIKHYPDTYKVWNFTAWWTGSSSTTVTISWDPNDVDDSEYDSVILYNSTNDAVADMLVDTYYSSSVASFNIISFQIKCMVDLDAPEITDNSPSSGTTGDSYTFNASVVDNLFDADDLLVKVNWSHGIFSSNDTMSNSGGNYFEATITLDENSISDLTYHYYAVDDAIIPNENYTSEYSTTITDNDPPVITGDSGNVGVGTGDIVTLWVTATDNIDVDSAEVSIDGGGSQSMSYNASWSRWEYNYSALSGDDSDHTYVLTVYDAQGLSDSSGPHDISVTDNDPPVITGDSGNVGVGTGDIVTLWVTATDNIDVDSAEVSIDGGGSQSMSYNASWSRWEYNYSALSGDDSDHTYVLTVYDAQGLSDSSGPHDISVTDNDPPVITGDSGNVGVGTGDIVTLWVTATDNIDVDSAEVSIDGGGSQSMSYNASWSRWEYNYSALSGDDSDHTYVLTVYDAQGLSDSSGPHDISVTDNDPPVITGDSGNVGVGTGDIVTLWVTATDNIDVDSAEVSIDGGGSQSMSYNASWSRWEYNYSALSGDDSDHTYVLTVYDAQGLSDSSGPHDISVTDNDPPVITGDSGNVGVGTGDIVTLWVTATDNIDVDSAEVSIDGGGSQSMSYNASWSRWEYNYSALSGDDSDHTYVLTVYDAQGLSDSSGPHDISVTDNDPPVITGDSGNVGVGTGDIVTLWVTATDNIDVDSAEVSIDGGGSQSMSYNASWSRWEYNYSALSGDDSDHTYVLTVYDAQGLSDSSGPHDISVTDNDPPVITGDSGNVGVGTGDIVTLWVTATDNIDVDSAEVSIDGGGSQSMSYNASWSRWEYNYSALSGDDSDHTYVLTVYDAQGLSDSSGPHDISVTDNDKPTISSIDANPDPQLVDNYVNITATVTDNINVDSVKVSINGPLGFTPINVSMIKNGGDVYYYNNNYSIVGIYNYTIWAIDTEGNSIESAIYQFEMVQELIITKLLQKWNFMSIPFNQEVNKNDLFVWHNGSRYNWTEATTGGDPILLAFIYNWSREDQNWDTGLTQILAPGYGYWMYAYHECELWAESISAFIRGDNITNLKYEWNAVGSPDSNSYNKEDLIIYLSDTAYTWTEATTGGDPIILGFIYNWSRSTQNYGFSDYLDPGYSYWIYAYYNCTLQFPSTYFHLNANKQIPTEKNTYEQETKSLKKGDIITENELDDRAINWDVTMNFDEPGGKNDYIIFGEASDGSDGQDSYDIPNPPPGIPPFIDAYFTTGFTSPYDKLIQEIKYYPDTYEIWNFTAWWTGSSSTTITISWDTDEVNDSEYNSVILYDSDDNPVADMIMNSSYSKSANPFGIISFWIECSSIANQPPEITCPGSQSVDEGSLLEFDVNATDPNGDIPALTAENLPSGADFTDNNNGTGTFSWTPTYNQAGSYDVTFNASDGELFDTCTVDITVDNVNRAPEISCPGSQSVDEDGYLEFDVSATDPDGTTPSLSAEDLPTGASFVDNGDGTGTFSWTPTYTQSGDYDVTFTASDGFLDDSCVVDITVNNVNRAPEITCPGDKFVIEDNLLEFDVSATDPDGTTPSLSAEDLPTGASFVDNGDGTGTFSWTPTHTQEGEYDVTFTASDGFLEDTCVVHITVYDAGPVPPVAVDDYYDVDEDTVDNVLDVLANDYDLNGDDITIIEVTDPLYGTVINHDDYITYKPNSDYYGFDEFTYTISDGDLTDSAIVNITVKNIDDPPETPDPPSGPTTGKAGSTYTYTAVTTDIEGDEISYLFDWGDETTSGWTEFAQSGTEVSASHVWDKGVFQIRVKAKDEEGNESNWSEYLEIEMPRSRERSYNNPIFNYFKERGSLLDFIRFLISFENWIAQYMLLS